MRSLHVIDRCLMFVCVLVLGGLLLAARPSLAQDRVPPQDWPSLSLEAFVEEVRAALLDPDVAPATRQEAAKQSAARLTALAPDAEVGYANFLWLYHWADDELTEAQRTALAPRRALPVDQIPDWTIDALRRVTWAQYDAQVPLAERDDVIIKWLENKTEVASYPQDIANVAWIVNKLRFMQGRGGAENVPEASLGALQAHVAQLLAQQETLAQAAYKDVVALFAWSQDGLSAETRAAVEAKVAAPQNAEDEIRNWPFHELRTADLALKEAEAAQSTRDAMLAQWLAANSDKLEGIQQPEPLAWLAKRVRRAGTYASAFSATWQGFIKPPTDGDYTFLISPIDVNLGDDVREEVRQSITLRVGDQQVITAGPENWTSRSEPISLRAGQLTPLRMEVQYADSSEDGNPRLRGTAAMLKWQLAGQSEVVVPTSALVPPSGEGVGVEVEYRLQEATGERVVKQLEPAIDRVWLRGDPLLAAHRDLLPALEDQLIARLSDESFLALAEQQLAATLPDWRVQKIQRTLKLAEQACCGRRSQEDFAQLLLARPALLRMIADPTELYRVARFSAPESALELFGSWAHLAADLKPHLTLDFYQQNRNTWRWAAQMMTWHYRPPLQELEDQYLTMPDGSCCLPVAYVVGYGHFSLGEIRAWIEQLDAILARPQLEGDLRVNWLIARAQAEEIRRGRAGRHFQTLDRWLAGLGWLQEAALVAQSPEVKLRVYHEMIGRFGARERLDDARALVEQARTSISGPQADEATALWQAELEALEAEIAARRAAREALAQQAYLDRLHERYQKAVAQEDDASAARYRSILTAAGVELD